MSDELPIKRQWNLLRSLSARHQGLTIREMTAETGVNAKTIRRDLDLFRSIGVHLVETTGEFGRKKWQIPPWNQPPLCFTFDEALSLYLGRQFLEPLAGTPFWYAAQTAFRKIRASLGDSAIAYLSRLPSSFHLTTFGFSDYTQKGELIDTLMVGAEDRTAVHISYQSNRATEPAFRDVYPYTFVFHKRALYLVAFDPQENKIKHYKVDRIEAAELSTFHFPRPPDFDPAAHLAPTFGVYLEDGPLITFKIRIAPSAVRYVLESKFHSTQTNRPQRDGSLIVEFQLSCTQELKSWILSFGTKALVLEPESLRREIADDLRALLRAYEMSDRLSLQTNRNADNPNATLGIVPLTPSSSEHESQ